MVYRIPFGADTVSFLLPDNLDIEYLSPSAALPAPDPAELIANALDDPIGSPPISGIVSPGQSVTILCDDISRPTPAHLILPPVIERLLTAGVQEEAINIVIALGSHRYMTRSEIEAKVGREIAARFKVENSLFKEPADLINLGRAPDGVEIYASSNAMSGDIRLGVGNIVPHNIMGWSGGAKILYPGIAGEVTVAAFHLQAALSGRNMFGEDDCFVRNNVETWVESIGLHFIINTVLNADFKLCRAFAGHYIAAHRQGVMYAKEILGAKTQRPADVVIVSSHPADQDLWQSAKAYFSAEHALRGEGGAIINISPNFEGAGPHAEYLEAAGDDNSTELARRVCDGEHYAGDALALSIGALVSQMRQRRKLIMVSDGLTQEEYAVCRLDGRPMRDLQSTIDETLAVYDDPVVTIITHGGEQMVYGR